MRELGKLVEYFTAGGALAGALATLAVAEPSLERSAAFWLLFVIFLALLAHILSPVWSPAFRALDAAIHRQKRLRDERQAFQRWVKVWFKLDALLRRALEAAANRATTEESQREAAVEYLVLRRILQQNRWPFIARLESRVTDNLPRVLRKGSGTTLEYQVERSRRPLRLFYSQPNLAAQLVGLCPDLFKWHGQTGVRQAIDVLDRIEDIIREFGAGMSIDVSEVVGRV